MGVTPESKQYVSINHNPSLLLFDTSIVNTFVPWLHLCNIMGSVSDATDVSNNGAIVSEMIEHGFPFVRWSPMSIEQWPWTDKKPDPHEAIIDRLLLFWAFQTTKRGFIIRSRIGIGVSSPTRFCWLRIGCSHHCCQGDLHILPASRVGQTQRISR